MNLHQELVKLAASAPPPASSEHLIRLARRAKARRALAAPLVVALATLIVFVPHWSPLRPELAQPTEPRSFVVLRANSPITNFQTMSGLLQTRAIALGMRSPRVRLIDPRTIELSVADSPAESLLRAVAHPQIFHARKALRLIAGTRGEVYTNRSGSSLDAVITRLGDAYPLAQSIQDPHHLDAGTLDKLIGFGQLSPAEVQLLPAEIQFNVPAVTCAQLLARPDFQGTPFDEKITTCYGTDKVLLDVAKLTSDDVTSAHADVEQGTSWSILNLTFTQTGSARLTELTREAFNNSGVTKCDEYARGARNGCFVALSVGANLIMLPEVQGVIHSILQVRGDFASGQAKALAQVISNEDPALTLHVRQTQVWDAPKAIPTSGR